MISDGKTPGADLTGMAISGSLTFSTNTLTIYNSGPGFNIWTGVNVGGYTQTANGTTAQFGTNSAFYEYVATAPAQTTNIMEFFADSFNAASPPYGTNYVYSYISSFYEGMPLNGLGPAHYWTLVPPGGLANVADQFEFFNWNPITQSYDVNYEILQFAINVPTGFAAEPSTLLQLGTGLAGIAGLWLRRRR